MTASLPGLDSVDIQSEQELLIHCLGQTSSRTTKKDPFFVLLCSHLRIRLFYFHPFFPPSLSSSSFRLRRGNARKCGNQGGTERPPSRIRGWLSGALTDLFRLATLPEGLESHFRFEKSALSRKYYHNRGTVWVI